jgi:hypothetical protein
MSMIFSENLLPLFGIMLYASRWARTAAKTASNIAGVRTPVLVL